MTTRTASDHPLRPAARRTIALVALVGVAAALAAPTTADALPPRGASGQGQWAYGQWIWPVAGAVVAMEYAQPAHRFGAGHRGIDLVVVDGEAVRSPARGAIAYVGDVAGKPVVTIDHGGGLVTSLEPVVSRHPVGHVIERGEPIGELGSGGHAEPGTVHFGVRLDGDYVNPRLLLGGIPRAVLLPCC